MMFIIQFVCYDLHCYEKPRSPVMSKRKSDEPLSLVAKTWVFNIDMLIEDLQRADFKSSCSQVFKVRYIKYLKELEEDDWNSFWEYMEKDGVVRLLTVKKRCMDDNFEHLVLCNFCVMEKGSLVTAPSIEVESLDEEEFKKHLFDEKNYCSLCNYSLFQHFNDEIYIA